MKNLLEEHKTVREKIFNSLGYPESLYLEIDDCTECQWHTDGIRVTFSETLSDNDYSECELELRRSSNQPLISSCGKFIAFDALSNREEVLSIFDRSLECVCVQDNSPPYDRRYKLKSEVK